jgi:hypothetical protein
VTVAVVVRAGRDYPPIAWRGWAAWRIGQVCPSLVEIRDLPAPASTDCPTCWAQGFLATPVKRPNGAIVCYQREVCPTCNGERRV